MKIEEKIGNYLKEDIHKKIQSLIDKGYTVRSVASGRMGKIVSVDGNDVTVDSDKGKGVTSFNKGDKVVLVKNTDKEYLIKNK